MDGEESFMGVVAEETKLLRVLQIIYIFYPYMEPWRISWPFWLHLILIAQQDDGNANSPLSNASLIYEGYL